MLDKIIDLMTYTVPSIVTGVVAYYFFVGHTESEKLRRDFELLKKTRAESLPIKLQAYERMTLFMERINPSSLLIRVTPNSDDKNMYAQKLIQSIEQEFEHNLAQQIYFSDECWSVLVTAKNTTAHIIQQITESDVKSSQELREAILKRMIESSPPSDTALSFIKAEVRALL